MSYELKLDDEKTNQIAVDLFDYALVNGDEVLVVPAIREGKETVLNTFDIDPDCKFDGDMIEFIIFWVVDQLHERGKI